MNGQQKLPEDFSNEVFYSFDKNGKIRTEIQYTCGCTWEIVWDDIKNGTVNEFYNVSLCEEHDPTIPYLDLKDDEY